MSALTFVNTLLDMGRVRVGPDANPPADLPRAVQALDRAARPQLAFEAPVLAQGVGEWALRVLYRGCQALVYREIEADAIRVALGERCPGRPSASACYSADLALRYLPELIGLARGIAADDPLVAGLRELAAAWPLSSVGVSDLPADKLDVAPFISHPSLARLYADRIIERSDVARLCHPTARDAVRESLGAFPQLAPRVAAALTEAKTTCPR